MCVCAFNEDNIFLISPPEMNISYRYSLLVSCHAGSNESPDLMFLSNDYTPYSFY